MREIFFKELAYYLKDARLYLGFIFIILTMGIGGLLYGRHRLDSMAEYSKAVAVEDEKVRDLSYRLAEMAEEEFKAYRKPRVLQFVADAEEDMRPNMVPYSTAYVGNPDRSRSLSYQMRRYERLDWSFAIGVLGTFLAVVLSFNSISGEKEEGTLRLILSNSVSRSSVLVAKLLALAASTFFPLVVGAILSMSAVTILSGTVFSAGELLRMMMTLGCGFLVLLVFVSIGLFVSAAVNRSVSSLVLLLLIWVVSVIILPSLGRLLAENTRGVIPASEVERRTAALLGEALEKYSGRDISHAPREVLPVDESEFLWDEMMDGVEGQMQDILDDNLRRKLDQTRTMIRIISISPVFLFRQTAAEFTGAGLLEDEHFIRDVRNFQESFLGFLRDRDASDPESPHILYRKWYMSYKPVDPGAVPKYTGGGVPLALSMKKGLVGAAALAAWVAAMCILALGAVQRMDAR